ncbi:Hypothetical protein SRAE_2000268400 [Strongyloides ratti]|uniref:Uncharacterized protein n=1 Tax=Strongyloides ratti TaxID=34506 RepID=A0A090LIR4_STRRB|nr:Hypothetical protein SRAE_2000268400 [Strongyloides ratti]CEF68023.1 Hypothetical protein SRAE_2000268400 [Strongyloides ratti]
MIFLAFPLDQHVEAIPSGYYDKLIEIDEPLKTVDVEETKEPGESLLEKGKHLRDDILGMFKKGHSDYPVSEPFTGKLEETKPSSELSGVPLEQHVEVIPTGYYDKLNEKDRPLKTVDVEEKREPGESLLDKGKHLKDEIFEVFKKDYSDYPVSEAYLGEIDNINKQSDLDQQPIGSQVSKYHVGYYGTVEKPKEETKIIQKEPSDSGDKKGRFAKITSIFREKSIDYPVDSEPYSGKIEETKPSSELTGVSLQQHVEAIPSEYYDKLIEKDEPVKTVEVEEIKEPQESLLEKGKHLRDDILGMFKKGHSDYPVSEPFTGKLEETKPSSELSGVPLDQHVEAIPSGYYDKLIEKDEPLKTVDVEETKEPGESFLEKGKHLKDEILGVFKKDYSDYPFSEPYLGEIDNINKQSDLDQQPIDSQVSKYHVGYYGTIEKPKEETKVIQKEPSDSGDKKGRFAKITSIFSGKTVDYPVDLKPFKGKLEKTKPSSELSGVPLEQHVEAIPTGYYEKLVEKDEPLKKVDVKEIKESGESFLEKGKHLKDDILGMFKKGHGDYPVSEPYIGKLEETKPSSELSGVPLDQHVEAIPSGYYDKLIEKDEPLKTVEVEEKREPGESLLEKGKHLKDEILGMFKKDYGDYPVSEPYIGKLEETKPSSELTGFPLQQHVEGIPTGYYDKLIEKDETLETVKEEEIKEPGESILERGKHLKDDILGMFKKGHGDYPVSEQFTGKLEETKPSSELSGVPLEQHVEVIPTGYYDKLNEKDRPLKTVDVEEKREPGESLLDKGKHLKDEIFEVFKKDYSDYPVSEAYLGEIDNINKQSDLDQQPIGSQVSKYHVGYYGTVEKSKEETKIIQKEPSDSGDKKGRFAKITSIFREKSIDYPVDSEPYSGKLEETKPSSELSDVPLVQYVEAIPTGYYEKLVEKDEPLKTVDVKEIKEPGESLLEKGKHLKDDILGMFKKGHGDYPVSEPYIGKLEETKPSSELSGVPLDQHVEAIPSGYYDKLIEKDEPLKTVEVEEKREPGESLLDKGKHLKDEILGVFKKDYSDYPVSEPYLGEFDNINKQSDLDEQPIDSQVSKYHVGYYETTEKPKEETKVIQKEPSDSGDKKGRFAKITSIFSGKSVDYPVDSEPYSGKLEKTKPSSELSGVPLDQHVEAIPTGHYEKLVEKDEPLKTVKVEEIKEPGESFLEKGKHLKDEILGMFKKGHSDYPVSEPYIGKLEETKPSSELSGVPLDQHVEAIPSGYYDKLIEKDIPLKTVDVKEIKEPSESLLEKGKHLKDEILGVFKKDYIDYPVSEPYLGEIDNINKQSDLELNPIDSQVSKYHVGYYGTLEKPKEDTKVIQKEPSDSGDKKGRFAKITSIFSGKSVDYPVDLEPYKGKLEEAKPLSELTRVPLQQHVEKIPTGYYEKLVMEEKVDGLPKSDDKEITKEPGETLLEKGKHLKDDILGMFKKGHGDYPVSEPYKGKLEETKPSSELTGVPLQQHVEVIPTGYYDKLIEKDEPLKTVVVEEFKEPVESLLEKGKHLKDEIFGMFKKGHGDYPVSEPYIGKLEETKPSSELSGVPLDQHVETIPTGYYDKLIKKDDILKTVDVEEIKEPGESLLEKGKHLKDEILGVFKKDYSDYPVSEPYLGTIHNIKKQSDLDQQAIDSQVSKYHVGYYGTLEKPKEETKVIQKEPSDSGDKKGRFAKITSIFSGKSIDYPVDSEPYSGKLEETKPSSELSGAPLEQHVEAIPTGYYEKLVEKDEPLKTVDVKEIKEPRESLLEKGKHLKDDILGMFKKDYADYPVSEPFTGKLEETKPSSELSGVPLQQHVEAIPSGYYDKLIEKDEPLKTVEIEEKREPGESLLDKGKHLKDEILGVFKKDYSDYPVSEPFTGKLEETKPSSELSGVPLEQHVEAIPTGYYEKLVKKDEPLRTADVKEIKEPGESFLEKGKHLKDDILGMFKKGHGDYPVSEPYIGKLEETKPSSELSGVPLDQHVEAIPSGYYDKLIEKDVPLKTVEVEEKREPSESLLEKGKHLKDEILGVFKKDYSDYPFSEPYLGEIDNINGSETG